MPEISDDDLKRYQGYEAQARSLADQVRTLQNQVTELTPLQTQLDAVKQERDGALQQLVEKDSAINNLTIGSAFDQALAEAGILPQYRDRFSDQISKLKVNEGAVTAEDGTKLTDFALSLKHDYPAMFAAEANPTGAGISPGASTGQTTSTAPRVLKPENGVIVGVSPDDLVSGSVKVEV